jgi:transposase
VDLITKLKEENEALKSQLLKKEEKIRSLEKINDWYIEQLKLRNKEKFGSSSERADQNQLSLFDLFNEAETLKEPIMIEPAEETLIPSHKRKKAKRGSNLSNLPVETIEYKLSDEEKVCDTCGNTLTEMKKEIRRELKVVPARVSIVEHITYVYSCRACDKEGTGGFIKKADSPKALIPKSMVSPSMMSFILNQKFSTAMPLYRQEQEFNRLGIELSRQNLSNWTIKGANLLKPLVAEMKIALLSEELLHADETTLEVLNEPGREATAKSFMWLYRTSSDSSTPVILFDYTQGRNGSYAKKFLENWQGKYLHCDGYAGYKKLEDITLCGCLVHAKRKFNEAYKASINHDDAKIGEDYIRKLFTIESKADNLKLSIEERLILRNTESKKVIEEFYDWIERKSLKTLPQSLLGKAITYAINQKEYLTSFLKDGRIQLSNNLALYTGFFYPHLFQKVS